MAIPFDPDKYHRQSLRLPGWDYTRPALYFITICTHQRETLFVNDTLRSLVESAWQKIPKHRHASHVQLDEWVVMSNHLHSILIITGTEPLVGKMEPINEQNNPLASTGFTSTLPHGAKASSVGAIIGNFKSLVTRHINNLRRTPGTRVWQRGYYDHIVRDEAELAAIRRYIIDNPRRWQEDRDNLDPLLARMRLVLIDES